MIGYDIHDHNIITFKIPLNEFSFWDFFIDSESEEEIKQKEKELELYLEKIFNARVNVINISRFYPLFRKYSMQLLDSFMAKKNKIKRRVYVAFRKSESFFKRLFSPGINQEALNIAGFYDPSKVIILITLFLRDQTINKDNFKERMTVNAIAALYRVTVHELTHYVYSISEGMRKETRKYVDDFYSDFFNAVFRGNFYRNHLIDFYDQLVECEGKRGTCQIEKIVSNIKETIKKFKNAAQDRNLYEETLQIYDIMVNETNAMKLFSNISFQKTMKKIYEKRGISDLTGSNVIHGQELVYPSEILCVTSEKLLVSPTGKKYASIVFRHL